MTPSGHPSGARPWTVWTPLGVALAVVLFLATIGSLGVGFGVMTGCTNTYNCTSTACTPCETTSAWLTAGWIGQGVLLLVAVVLVVLAARRRRLPAVRMAALVLPVLGVALIVVTTALATAAI